MKSQRFVQDETLVATILELLHELAAD
jgi:hypothetical protein